MSSVPSLQQRQAAAFRAITMHGIQQSATTLVVLLAAISARASSCSQNIATHAAIRREAYLQQQPKQQQQQRALFTRRLLQVRGGVATPTPNPRSAEILLRGGRTSDKVVFVEAIAETALESAMIVGFVGLAAHLADMFVVPKYAEVARLLIWTAAVFFSGAATAGPRRFLETSQLFNIENPISEDWYENLRKPRWNPPNWVFPIMWVPLKILQVFACYEMWDKLEKRNHLAIPVIAFAVYKSLGDVWNKVFFVRRRLKLGTLVISLYYLSLWVGIKLFFDVSDRAGYLFAPTAAWVTVATALQWRTWLLNRDRPYS